MAEALRVAVVGCGKIAEHHMRAMNAVTGLAVSALIDPDRSARERLLDMASGSPALLDQFDQLPDGAAELVLLCVPHHLHEPLGLSVLERGFWLVCEKPLATTEAGCARLLQAANQAAGGLFVAENSAFWPEVAAVRRILDQGELGKLITITSHYYESLVDTPFGGSDPSDLGWRNSIQKCGGGVVMDGGLHWLRPLRLLAGPVRAVCASLACPLEQMEGESLCRCLAECEGGVKALFQCTLLGPTRLSAQEPWIRVTCELGELVVHAKFDGGLTVFSPDSPQGAPVPVDSPAGFNGSFTPMWAKIAQCVAGGAAGKAEAMRLAEQAAEDVQLVHAIYASASERRWVSVPAPDDPELPAQLEFIAQSHGLETVHGGRGTGRLLDHLTGTRAVLRDKFGCPEPHLASAALFHSIYGTEGFQGVTLPMGERAQLQQLIGPRAERLAYLNCVMDRSSLDQAVLRYRQHSQPLVVSSRPELGAEQFELSRGELRELMIVHLADWHEQVEAYSFWSYRRQQYAGIAAALGGRFAELYAERMASEPEEAPAEVPEMVRARQQGIFEKVQSGEVAYSELLKS